MYEVRTTHILSTLAHVCLSLDRFITRAHSHTDLYNMLVLSFPIQPSVKAHYCSSKAANLSSSALILFSCSRV